VVFRTLIAGRTSPDLCSWGSAMWPSGDSRALGIPTRRHVGAREEILHPLSQPEDGASDFISRIERKPSGGQRETVVSRTCRLSHVDGTLLIEYSSSPLPGSFFKGRIMNNFTGNPAQMLASRKECYAQKDRSPQ
jgi:hypothetical protein